MSRRLWSNGDVYAYRRAIADGRKTVAQLARELGASYSVVASMVFGETYKDVPFPKGIDRATPRRKLTIVQVRKIKNQLADGRKGDAIAAEFGISAAMVSMINTGKRFADVTINP